MARRFLLVVLSGSLLFACSEPKPNPRSTSGVVVTQDSAAPRLPVEYWAGQLKSPSWAKQKGALGNLGAYEAASTAYIPAITPFLVGADDSLGFTAAWALAHIGASAHPTLIRYLKSPNASVRRRAAYGLGEAGEAAGSSLTPLRALADSDPVMNVRDMAHWAIARIAPVGRVADPNMGLMEGLDSEDTNERVEAVRRLGAAHVSNRAAMTGLIRLLGDSIDAVQHTAIDALVQKGKAALPLLTRALENPRDRVRAGAMLAIARIRVSF